MSKVVFLLDRLLTRGRGPGRGGGGAPALQPQALLPQGLSFRQPFLLHPPPWAGSCKSLPLNFYPAWSPRQKPLFQGLNHPGPGPDLMLPSPKAPTTQPGKARSPHPKGLRVLALPLPPIQGPKLLRKQPLDYWVGQAEASPGAPRGPGPRPVRLCQPGGLHAPVCARVSACLCIVCVCVQVRPCAAGGFRAPVCAHECKCARSCIMSVFGLVRASFLSASPQALGGALSQPHKCGDSARFPDLPKVIYSFTKYFQGAQALRHALRQR